MPLNFHFPWFLLLSEQSHNRYVRIKTGIKFFRVGGNASAAFYNWNTDHQQKREIGWLNRVHITSDSLIPFKFLPPTSVQHKTLLSSAGPFVCLQNKIQQNKFLGVGVGVGGNSFSLWTNLPLWVLLRWVFYLVLSASHSPSPVI